MAMDLSPASKRVQEAIVAKGFSLEIREFSESTHSSQEAALAIGCSLGQIAKSLVFKSDSGKPVLIIASGVNRVSEEKVKGIVGEKISRADPDFVKKSTGFSIGGVPPLPVEGVIVLVDGDLLKFQEVWAAAGTSNSVFKLAPAQLVELCQGKVCDLKA
jgi:prolyl-tRNA editing enzyme YbaK/EbsC (Cys-tRNA(Pro) deacylase)